MGADARTASRWCFSISAGAAGNVVAIELDPAAAVACPLSDEAALFNGAIVPVGSRRSA
jgi:hypothetical protein